jgi:hypothetical protein
VNHSSEPSRRTATADGLDVVEFDADRERFQTRFDPTQRSASLAIAEMIAAIGNTSPLDLTPLSTTIDTDALDALLSTSPTGDRGCDSISFHYEGFEVTVDSDGRLQADPLEQP